MQKLGQSEKKEKEKTNCTVCKKLFVVLLTHLNKSEKCKQGYGDDYNKIKSAKDEERKNYQKAFRGKNKEDIKDYQKKYR